MADHGLGEGGEGPSDSRKHREKETERRIERRLDRLTEKERGERGELERGQS